MKRTVTAGLAALGALAMLGLGAGTAPAASPAVDKAIKAVEEVGTAPDRLKLYCRLNQVLQGVGQKDDPAVEKQIDDLVTQLGPDFRAAWEVGDDLDESSEDGKAFYAAVDALSEKCK